MSTASLSHGLCFTRDMASPPRGAIGVRALLIIGPLEERGRREGRALAAPVARPQKRMQAAVTTGLAEHARPSLRDGFDSCSALSPGTVFVAPVIRDTVVTDLASATGCQDHTA
jgi:hypothetical protein